MNCSTHVPAAMALVLATTAGCKATMSDFIRAEEYMVKSDQLRGARIDEQASALDWRPETLVVPADTGDQVIREIRTDLAEGLDYVFIAGDDKPARFRVTVLEAEKEGWLTWFPCFLALTLVGCPGATSNATVQVELEVEGTVYKEIGTSSSVLFLYTDESKPQTVDEVAAAVVDAVRKIDDRLARGSSQHQKRPTAVSRTGVGAADEHPVQEARR